MYGLQPHAKNQRRPMERTTGRREGFGLRESVIP